MALLEFPLKLDAFFDDLPIMESAFDLDEAVTSDETEGGSFYSISYGEQLWHGSIQVQVRNPHDSDRFAAKVGVLRRAGTTFLVSYKHRAGPLADPLGTALASYTPTVAAVAANNRAMSVQGLPPAYQISEGDRLSFTHGNPAKVAMHRVVSGAAADPAGKIAELECDPPIRPSDNAGAAITLVNPYCKAQIVPGSYQPQRSRSGRTYGFSVEWRQVLR